MTDGRGSEDRVDHRTRIRSLAVAQSNQKVRGVPFKSSMLDRWYMAYDLSSSEFEPDRFDQAGEFAVQRTTARGHQR